MTSVGPTAFDPETIQTLRLALDQAWDSLPADERPFTSKSLLAQRILTLAAQGERDPARLRACAILSSAKVMPRSVEG